MNIDFSSYLNYFSYNSVVILSYFFICLIILIVNYLLKDKLNNFLVFRRGNIFNPMNYIRIITSGFCHKDWEHFKNNFVIILLIGPLLEEKYGSINILYMILITSFVSSVFHLIFYNSVAIGASDNAYMFIVLCSIVNIGDGKIPITLLLIILFYVLDEFIMFVFHKKDNVSHDSHIIGAFLGFVFGYFIF